MNRILRDYRKGPEGWLDFSGIKEKELGSLDQLIRSFRRVSVQRWEQTGKDDRKAFWMNAHLAVVLSQISKAYPVDGEKVRFLPRNSIQQIESFWDTEFSFWKGRESLRSIEQKLLSEEFADPAAVVVLYAGTVGGPPPPDEVWSGRSLDEQIERHLRKYMESERGFRLDEAARRMWIPSPFFFWRADIVRLAPTGRREGEPPPFDERKKDPWNVYPVEEARFLSFVAKFLSKSVVGRIQGRRYEIKELAFDWALADGTPPPKKPEGIPLDPEAPYKEWKEGEMPLAPVDHLPRKWKKKTPPGEIEPLFGDK
ncbi:MAG: hypothetical protein AB1405_06165 [Bdellovibrionota bacterium]